jgi:hypothetical protein
MKSYDSILVDEINRQRKEVLFQFTVHMVYLHAILTALHFIRLSEIVHLCASLS